MTNAYVPGRLLGESAASLEEPLITGKDGISILERLVFPHVCTLYLSNRSPLGTMASETCLALPL